MSRALIQEHLKAYAGLYGGGVHDPYRPWWLRGTGYHRMLSHRAAGRWQLSVQLETGFLTGDCAVDLPVELQSRLNQMLGTPGNFSYSKLLPSVRGGRTVFERVLAPFDPRDPDPDWFGPFQDLLDLHDPIPRPPWLPGQCWLMKNGRQDLVLQAGDLTPWENPDCIALLHGPSPWGRDVPWVDPVAWGQP